MIVKRYYKPQPKRLPKRLPRKQPIKVVPSGIGDEGIVGNWLFYYLKGGDHLHDFSPYDNHGTLNGPVWKDGRYGWALDFDGVDDYVTAPHDASLNPQGPMTITAWYRTDVVDGNYHQVAGKALGGGGGSYKLYQDADNVFSFRVVDGASTYFPNGTTTVETDTWYFVVGRITSTDVEIWVNGNKENSVSGGIGNSQGVFAFGTNPGNLGEQLVDGTIVIVRIYSVAKSESWIERRFERTRGIFGV